MIPQSLLSDVFRETDFLAIYSVLLAASDENSKVWKWHQQTFQAIYTSKL